MKIKMVDSSSNDYTLKIDILEHLGYWVILFLCILGIVPWWFFLALVILSFKGIYIKLYIGK